MTLIHNIKFCVAPYKLPPKSYTIMTYIRFEVLVEIIFIWINNRKSINRLYMFFFI